MRIKTGIMGRYSFSGHESFFCKPLWLKKAYDSMNEGVNFTSPDAVAALGVGKNMVASIRFWSRAFGLSTNDIPTSFATSIFDTENGFDPYLEDEGTLWLLHYFLLTKRVASLYHLTFLDFQREKREGNLYLGLIFRYSMILLKSVSQNAGNQR